MQCLSISSLLTALVVIFSSAFASGQTNGTDIVSFSSLRPYLGHALRDCRCYEISDAFDARDCRRACTPFKKKMLAWAKQNPVLYRGLELQVEPYSFSKRAFTLNYWDSVMPDIYFSRVDHDGIFIGKSSCDRVDGELTEMVAFKHRISAKMPESQAKASVLRDTRSVTAVAILKGQPASINWCCGPYARRNFALDKAKCRSRGFRYVTKDMAVGMTMVDDAYGGTESSKPGDGDSTEPWIKGFKTKVKVSAFQPAMAGISKVPGSMRD